MRIVAPRPPRVRTPLWISGQASHSRGSCQQQAQSQGQEQRQHLKAQEAVCLGGELLSRNLDMRPAVAQAVQQDESASTLQPDQQDPKAQPRHQKQAQHQAERKPRRPRAGRNASGSAGSEQIQMRKMNTGMAQLGEKGCKTEPEPQAQLKRPQEDPARVIDRAADGTGN